jgi:hypothetical protein
METTDSAPWCYGAELFFLLCRLSYWGRSLEAVAVCVSSGRPGAASIVFSHSVEIGEAFWPAPVCVAPLLKQG